MLRYSTIIIIIGLLALAACSERQVPDEAIPDSVLAEIFESKHNPYDTHLDTVVDSGCTRLRTNFRGSMSRTFKDKNDVHTPAARIVGFSPITCDDDIWKLNRDLVYIESCPEYYLEELTHSFPYLVPEAAQLLKDIGRTFNDSLAARGGGSYRMRVTSVLRTPATVKKLRRVNRNSTEASVHCYGTTFDISHSKFVCDNLNDTRRTFGELKLLLAEVLNDLKKQGRCYVKYEYRQACFHITARPKPTQQ